MHLGCTLYIQDTLTAVPFYLDAFGLTLGYCAHHPDGTYMHATLMRDGQEIFCVSECANPPLVDALLATPAMPPTSLGLDFPTLEEARRAFDLLAAGGNVIRPFGILPWDNGSGDVIDRWGVCWYLCCPKQG
ncbi:MAG: VOC family protein [Clostridia bacterium]|nr:VOC family protein [Clostridia bacterium]